MNPEALNAVIKAEAHGLGFDACGVAAAGAVDLQDRLGEWLRRGFQADMAWMERTKALRQDPRVKLPGAQSVIVVARNYYRPTPESEPGRGRIARYALGRDYHKVLKRPLKRLAAFVEQQCPGSEHFLSVDSGPVLERSWAERAGVGWIGKNSLVLRRDIGSWFFLGALVTTAEIAPDAPYPINGCGSCTACLDACPTQAIVEPGVVDSNRCISYNTIENRGEIASELHQAHADWVFGCDICQEVCPWNRFATETTEPDFAAREGALNPSLEELAGMDEATFNARFEGTPIRRAKHAGMVRNARIALANLHS